MDELTNAEKIQAVINTLEMLDIKPTYDNTNKLLGIYNTLATVMDSVREMESEKNEADAE